MIAAPQAASLKVTGRYPRSPRARPTLGRLAQPDGQGNARRKLSDSAKPYCLSATSGWSAMKPSRDAHDLFPTVRPSRTPAHDMPLAKALAMTSAVKDIPGSASFQSATSRSAPSLPHQVPNEHAENTGTRKRRHPEEPPALDPLENTIRRLRPVATRPSQGLRASMVTEPTRRSAWLASVTMRTELPEMLTSPSQRSPRITVRTRVRSRRK